MKDLDDFLQADCANCSCDLPHFGLYTCPMMILGLSAVQIVCMLNADIAEMLIQEMADTAIDEDIIEANEAEDFIFAVTADFSTPPTCRQCEGSLGCKHKLGLAHLIQSVALNDPDLAVIVSLEADKIMAGITAKQQRKHGNGATSANQPDNEDIVDIVNQFLRNLRDNS